MQLHRYLNIRLFVFSNPKPTDKQYDVASTEAVLKGVIPIPIAACV